jgi:hypothetical protein
MGKKHNTENAPAQPQTTTPAPEPSPAASQPAAADTASKPAGGTVTAEPPGDGIRLDMTYEEILEATKKPEKQPKKVDQEPTTDKKTTTGAEQETSQEQAAAPAPESGNEAAADDRAGVLARARAALVRQERELQKQKQALKAEAERTQAALASERTKVQRAEQLLEKLQSDPAGFFKAAGLDFTEVAQRIVSDGKPSPESIYRQLNEQLSEHKKTIAALQQRQTEYQQHQEASTYLTEYRSLIADDKYQGLRDYYDLLGWDPAAEVGDIYSHFETAEGKRLTPREIADIIQNGAEDQLRAMVGRPAYQRIREHYGSPKGTLNPAPVGAGPAGSGTIRQIGRVETTASTGKPESQMSLDELAEHLAKQAGF